MIGFGWRYFRGYETKRSAAASRIYQAMMMANVRSQTAVVQQYAKQLMTQYKNTGYATVAALFGAQADVKQKKLGDAYQKLQWAISHGKNAPLKQIARLRAARVLIEEKKAKEALNLLDTVDDKTFAPRIAAVKGDAYAAMGDHKQSMAFYQKAKSGYTTQQLVDPVINAKLAS